MTQAKEMEMISTILLNCGFSEVTRTKALTLLIRDLIREKSCRQSSNDDEWVFYDGSRAIFKHGCIHTLSKGE